MTKFLWLGAVFDENAEQSRAAASPAEYRWQRGLINALGSKGYPVHLIGHLAEPLWPKGQVCPDGEPFLDSSLSQRCLRYWNLPALRARSLCNAYCLAVDSYCRQHAAPECLFTYNAWPWKVAAARHAKREFSIKWVNLTLDYDDPGENFEKYTRAVSGADAHVILSWAAFEGVSLRPKLHLDAGVDEVYESPLASGSAQAHTFMYSGRLTEASGAGFLTEAIRQVKRQDVRFMICGKDKGSPLEQLAQKDPRVDFVGYVSSQELHELSLASDFFLNPRPPGLEVNRMVFPSKLTNYLAYGKPVVSTWTLGLAPEFRDLLIVSSGPSPTDFANAIEKACEMTLEQRNEHRKFITESMKKKRLWSQQAERLIDFLHTEQLIAKDAHDKA